jgi:hypothetical protein
MKSSRPGSRYLALIVAPALALGLEAGQITGPGVALAENWGPTQGFDVYNLSQYPIQYVFAYKDKDSADPVVSPKFQTVFKPGQAAHFELPNQWRQTIVGHQVVIYPTPSGLLPRFQTMPPANSNRLPTTFEAHIQDPNAPKGQTTAASCQFYQYTQAKDGTCTPSSATNSNQVFILDPPGTTVKIPGDDQNRQAQADLLESLCGGTLATCDYTNMTQDQIQGQPVLPTKLEPVYNVNDPQPVTMKIKASDTVTETSSFEHGVSAGTFGKLGKIIDAKIEATWHHTVTKSSTFEQEQDWPIPLHNTGCLWHLQPLYHYSGEFIVKAGNTTWDLQNVTVDLPDTSPSARGAWGVGIIANPPNPPYKCPDSPPPGAKVVASR